MDEKMVWIGKDEKYGDYLLYFYGKVPDPEEYEGKEFVLMSLPFDTLEEVIKFLMER